MPRTPLYSHAKSGPPLTSPASTISPPRRGNNYVLVTNHKGYIKLEPMKSRDSSSYIAAFTRTLDFFADRKHPVVFLVLDNETSADLKAFF